VNLPNLKPRQLVIPGIALAVVVIGALIYFNLKPNANSLPKVTLVFWGLEEQVKFEKIISGYKELNKNVTIDYKQIKAKDYAEYRDMVFSALAAGQGPDVFMIRNHDAHKEANIIYPAPSTQFTSAQLNDLFPTVAAQDFVFGGQVYALPLYIDTMALLYNKDLFDAAGIAEPPKTWENFLKIIPQLRQLDQNGRIVRAASAIGGLESSVDRAVDLLNLLMLQNGAAMNSQDLSRATFANQKGAPEALDFYAQFSNGASPYYTWNESMQNSVDSFSGGKTAAIFDYQSVLPGIKNKSPFLRVGISAVPSTGATPLTYADYVGLTTPKNGKWPTWAWDFIIYATTNRDAVAGYLDSTGRPPALRGDIAKKIGDADLGVFAKQALSARSWAIFDYEKTVNIFNNAIRSVILGGADSDSALKQAEDQINQLAQ